MKHIKRKVRAFMEERDWLTQPPANVAKSIVLEGAELLEHFQWNNATVDEIMSDPDKLEEIGKELADVVIYCAEFAILFSFDVEKLVESKLEHARKKYPADKIKGASNLREYLKIKKAYREKSRKSS